MVRNDRGMKNSITRQAPTPNHDCFHGIKSDWGSNSITTAIKQDRLTKDDADLILSYAAERQANRQISDGRRNKLIYHLVDWRRYIGAFRNNTLADLHRGIIDLQKARFNGRPYKRNTLHDKIEFLRQFNTWLAENQITTIPLMGIQKIEAPKMERITKTPDQIFSREEVLSMIAACQTSRDRCLVSILYEAGLRIIEIATLTWGNIALDEYGARIRVCEKTDITRTIRLTASKPYIATWKNDYPYEPSGDALVFFTRQNKPLQYEGVAQHLKDIARRGGIQKKFTPHLMRHTRITHMVEEGVDEAVIKMFMWGTLRTTQLATYAQLTADATDHRYLDLMGIPHKQKAPKKFVPAQCPRCGENNTPTARFCTICGCALTEEVEATQNELIDYIDKHPEIRQILQRRYAEGVT
jgi:site-specific recombinase XerD